LIDYIKSKTAQQRPTECPICRVQISQVNLDKLNITKFVPTSDPAGQYIRANIPVPEGGFILPRLTRFQSSENVQILNQLRGYNFKVYKPTGGNARFMTDNNLYNIDGFSVSEPQAAYPSGTWYVGLGNFMMRFYTDYVYVAEPPPATLPSLYEIIFGNNTQPGIISTRYNELYSSSGCTVSGGKRRGTKRRRSTRRKGYKKRSTKRRGTRRRR
jgi:hypothetical protein